MLTATRNRIRWIDCAKGAAMLLVIIGHTLNGGRFGMPVRGLIYSVHMPLFFFLSAATYRASDDSTRFLKNMRRAAKRLLLPFLGLVVFQLGYELWQAPDSVRQGEFWVSTLLRLTYASGTSFTQNGETIKGVGFAWFLLALFSGRTLFDYLQWKLPGAQLPIFCAVFSVLGFLLGQTQRLPFSWDIALAIQPFFYFGF